MIAKLFSGMWMITRTPGMFSPVQYPEPLLFPILPPAPALPLTLPLLWTPTGWVETTGRHLWTLSQPNGGILIPATILRNTLQNNWIEQDGERLHRDDSRLRTFIPTPSPIIPPGWFPLPCLVSVPKLSDKRIHLPDNP